MLSITDLKTGAIIQYNNEPYQVVFAQHVQMGRGGAIMRTKLKNLITGNSLEKTFKPGDKFDEADLSKTKANFLYAEGENYFFMNNETFEQFSLSKAQIGEKMGYIKEGMDADIVVFNNKPINIDIPIKIDLKVAQTPEGVRGDTAQGSVTKEATLETGQVIKVPLFIKKGDVIRVNTETGKYVERVKEE